MDTAGQLLMGVSIASCAGLRTFLPLLAVGMLGHFGGVPLNPSYAFLARPDALIVFGVAAVLELLADKIIAVDHLLDAVGTIARPLAGFVVAASLITKADPLTTTALALVAGGATSFTVHAGKAALRYKSSALAPLHGGAGNFLLSIFEDVASAGWLCLAAFLPLAAFALTIALLTLCGWLVVRFIHTGRRLWSLLRGRPAAEQLG
jgi:hypothetical protein